MAEINRKIHEYREVVSRVTKLLSQKEIKVRQAGDKAYVEYDPRTKQPSVVNLPYIADSSTDEQLNAVKGFLDYEVSSVLFSDFSSVDPIKNSVSKEYKELFDNFANLIEHQRTSVKMGQEFPGSASKIENLTKMVIDSSMLPAYKKAKREGDEANSIVAALGIALQAYGGNERAKEVFNTIKDDNPFGEYAEKLAWLEEAVKSASSTEDSYSVARKTLSALVEDETPTDGEGEGEGEGGSDKEKKDGNKESKESKKEVKEGEGDENDEGEGESDEGEGEGEGDEGVELNNKLTSVDFSDVSASKIDVSKVFSDIVEFDNKDYAPVTTDYDVVEKFVDNSSSGFSAYSRVEKKLKVVTGQISARIKRLLAAKTNSINYGGFRSGKIQSSALHRLSSGDDRVFYRKEEFDAEDSAVSLVIDASGSMHGSRWINAIESAIALGLALDRLNIPCEIIGFTTGDITNEISDIHRKTKTDKFARIEPLYMPVFKDFNERFTSRVKGTLGSLIDGSGYSVGKMDLRNNVDGESVMIAYRRLLVRPEKKKIMLVLSDGEPAAMGDKGKQCAHLKNVVDHIMKEKRVHIVGLGIETSSVKRFYKDYAVINDPNKIASVVVKRLERFILG